MFFTILSMTLPFYFDADDGGAGGGTSTGEGDNKPGPDGGATGGAGGDSGTPPGNEQRFTQADLDRIAGQTRQQALARWAREQGYDDPNEIASIIEAKREADEQAKSELEKAQSKTEKEKARADANENLAFRILLRSAFDRAAGSQVDDLDLAYLAATDLKLLTSEAGIKVDLESLKVEGMDKAVKTLLEEKPILKKTTNARPPSTGGGEGGTPPPSPLEIDDQKKAEYQRRFGVGT